MITIHNIEEMFLFYTSMGARWVDTENGFCFVFPDKTSYVRFWGDLNGFAVACADFVYPKEAVIRTQFSERYIGVGLNDGGNVVAYSRKNQLQHFRQGINCYVFDSPGPFFMRVNDGERLQFRALYFQEQFFRENDIRLYDSFWRDAKASIGSQPIHAPEFVSIYHRIEKCRLTGDAFNIWIRGQGLSAVGYILDLVQKYSVKAPVYLDDNERRIIENAKSILKSNLANPPTILELCKSVCMNKNKLQEIFRLTEGKSIAEYVRTLRMEQALELLETSDLSMKEIAQAIGYHGIGNFYSAFKQTFGETPAMIQRILSRRVK